VASTRNRPELPRWAMKEQKGRQGEGAVHGPRSMQAVHKWLVPTVRQESMRISGGHGGALASDVFVVM
jgi:hypothetical protein